MTVITAVPGLFAKMVQMPPETFAPTIGVLLDVTCNSAGRGNTDDFPPSW